MVCVKCSKEFTSGNEAAQCCECGQRYHAACCRLRTARKLQGMLANQTATWRCDACAADTASTHSDDISVAELLKKLQEEVAESRKENNKSFKTLESALTAVNSSLEEMKAKLSVVEAENVALKSECSELAEKNKRLFDKTFSLQCEVHELQQYSRNKNLEVRGIPTTAGEDVYSVLESLATAITIPYDRQDISVAHRLGRTGTIVVQFISRTTRAQWLAAAKTKRVSTTDLKTSLPHAAVFVNEHLTRHNRILLGQARALVREKRLAFAWSKDGKIMVRRAVGERAVQVFFEEDVLKEALPRRDRNAAPVHSSNRQQ